MRNWHWPFTTRQIYERYTVRLIRQTHSLPCRGAESGGHRESLNIQNGHDLGDRSETSVLLLWDWAAAEAAAVSSRDLSGLYSILFFPARRPTLLSSLIGL
jgi:hypothetical protein